MNNPINWQSIAAPLDVMNIEVPATHLRRWLDYTQTETGVIFRCQLGDETETNFQLDVIRPDIVRVRMAADEIDPGLTEILVENDWPTPSFEISEQDNALHLTTDKLRVEFQQFPWQMRVFDQAIGSEVPFFKQQYNDRAYGYAYEIPPTGFEQGTDGQLTVRETIAVTPGEKFYGFGEKFTPIDKWGQEIVSWAVDSGNVSSHRSYKNVPFFMSSAGYGLFVNSSHPMVYRMGTESSISYSIHLDDDKLDYFLIHGPKLKTILAGYTDLTGRAPVPPKWSFGFWISRCGYKTREEVEEVIRGMRARDFPCDVISLDPWWMGEAPWTTYRWDEATFPQPEAMMKALGEQNIRTCLWIHPYVPAGTAEYADAEAKGYFVCHADGSVSPALEAFSGTKLGAIDFTNPQAVDWFKEKLEALLKMGVAVFKSDFGEQAPIDAVYADGRSGLEIHNLYPLLYNKAVFEITEKYFGRGLTWGRSGYAGSQRYPIQWGGDSYSSLDQVSTQLKGLLGYGLSGVPYCSFDVGGFDYSPEAFDEETQTGYPKDVAAYIRALQFGVFSSHIRAHGKQPREPWTYGTEAEEISRKFLNLRYRLLPYIYTEAVKSTRSGLPMVKPLVLEYQDDPNTHRIDQQYLFGDSFLVAPVLTATGQCQVYLPKGDWVDFWTKESLTGGRWLTVDAALDTIPAWVKAGSIIPLGPITPHVEAQQLDPLTLKIYHPAENGTLTIHDEDKPDINVRYTRTEKQLTVEVDPTPGDVELIVYGVSVTQATCNEKSLAIQAKQDKQTVRFDAKASTKITFEIENQLTRG
jgi:alpha-D-xyloside xylohydrolase